MPKRSVEVETARKLEGAALDMRGLMALAERVLTGIPQDRQFDSVINDLMAIQHHGARIQEALGQSHEVLHELSNKQTDLLMHQVTQPGGLLSHLEAVAGS